MEEELEERPEDNMICPILQCLTAYHREERAHIQRQRSLPSTPLFELTEHYNARDHRYPHGGFK